MEHEGQVGSEVGAPGPADGPAPLAAGAEIPQDMEASGEQAAEAAAGADSEADADEADRAMQSTFESRPSKSVADFTASGICSPSTSAATSELEAKLRQRMLKCEGTDVIHRVASPVVKASSEVGNPGKADELVRTAAYQRCTKVRQESGHSAGDGGEEGRKATEGRRAGPPPGEGDGGEELDSEEGPEVAPDAAPEEQKPSAPSAPPAPSVPPAPLAPPAPPVPSAPSVPPVPTAPVVPALALGPQASAPQASSEASLAPAPFEALLTPRSDGGGAGSGEASDFGSVVSQDEFFEPADTAPTCATFALDDPMRDCAEERSGDTRTPQLLDLEDGSADDVDGAPAADLSVEECLLDLVNHIPPMIAQRIGTLFQHFESVRREAASDAPPQPPPPHPDCLAYERQVAEHEEASRLRQEQLERQLRDQAEEHSSEARILREELEESRQRSSQLQLPPASAEAELQEAAGGELESMSAALADADTRLIDVGVRLEVTSQQSDRFRGKAGTAGAELRQLRQRVEEAGEQLRASEEERDRLGAEAGDREEAQQRLRAELEREAEARREAQERLDLELAGVRELSEAAAEARAQLARWGGEREEAQARLAASQRAQRALAEELAFGEELQGLLRDEAAAARARSSEAQEGLRRQVAEAEAAAQRRRAELEQAQAEVLALQAPAAEAARLRAEVAAEGAAAQSLRSEAQLEEAALRSEVESRAQDVERLRQEMEAADSRAHAGRSVDLLAVELASAKAEKEEASRVLQLEHEQLVEQRGRSLALACENEELRGGQEELRARLEAQEQEMARSSEQGARRWEARLAELEERRASILAEAGEVRAEKAKIRTTEEEQSGMVALVQDLVRRVEEVDEALQQGRRQELRTSAALESVCSERSALERDLDVERGKMVEEREMRAEAEKDAMTLAGDKETLCRRLKSAMSEADRGRKHEAYMGSELAALRRALVAEAEEMKAEIARRHHCRVESRQLQAARSELQSRLRAEEAAVSPPGAPAPAPRGAHGRRDAQALRDELFAEREQLADHAKRMAQLQQFREALDAETPLLGGGVAPSAPSAASGSQKARDVRTLQDSLKRQLYRAGEATRARGDPRRVPALSEELREVEEEGKVRREQLEAETSLMAMEVVTLTKGLGGRLLDTGIIGLHRNPLTAHDIRFRLGAVSRTSAGGPRAGAGGCGPSKVPGKIAVKVPGAAAAEGSGPRGAGSCA